MKSVVSFVLVISLTVITTWRQTSNKHFPGVDFCRVQGGTGVATISYEVFPTCLRWKHSIDAISWHDWLLSRQFYVNPPPQNVSVYIGMHIHSCPMRWLGFPFRIFRIGTVWHHKTLIHMHCTDSIMITTHQMDVLAMHGASTEVKLKKSKMCHI